MDTLTLSEGRLGGYWIVLDGHVNIADLVSGGSIVRISRPDALRYIPPSWDNYDRIAGMISDAA